MRKLNYLIDILSFIVFLIVAFSGVVMYFWLPEGVRRGGYQEFWGLAKHTWVNIHDVFGFVLIVLVIIHFVLHWRWLAGVTKDMFSRKNKAVDLNNKS